MADACAVFDLLTHADLGPAIAKGLGVSLQPYEERVFSDGEHKIRPLVSVRGHDVYVLASLENESDHSVNDKLLRLLFFIGALKDARAARVTVVAPYLCYARKDRKTKPRDPVTTRYVACLFEAVGVDGMVTMDVHNLAAFQNAFRCPTEHLEATRLFVDALVDRLPGRPLVVVSPDPGGVKRADAVRHLLHDRTGQDIPVASLQKHRSEDVVSGETLLGDLDGRTALLVDDLISTGTTLVRAARACASHGAAAVWALATHALFSSDAPHVLSDAALDRLIVTNSVPLRLTPGTPLHRKTTVLNVAPFLADALSRLHREESIAELLTTAS